MLNKHKIFITQKHDFLSNSYLENMIKKLIISSNVHSHKENENIMYKNHSSLS